MKTGVINLFIISFAFLVGSCSEHQPVQKKKRTPEEVEKKLELEFVDFFDFRRNYFGSDTLYGRELDEFMNRNPEMGFRNDLKQSRFYRSLNEHQIIQDETLNLAKVESDSNNFTYHYDKNRVFDLKITSLEYSPELKDPGYILTFEEHSKIVLVDTLQFPFPAAVLFHIKDLDHDGKDEILALHQWYIINGDNYDLSILQVH